MYQGLGCILAKDKQNKDFSAEVSCIEKPVISWHNFGDMQERIPNIDLDKKKRVRRNPVVSLVIYISLFFSILLLADYLFIKNHNPSADSASKSYQYCYRFIFVIAVKWLPFEFVKFGSNI